MKQLWETRAIRNSFNVPIYHEGSIYAYSSRFLTCVDPKTGEARWRSRPPGDGFMILVDGHLVITTKKGSVHIVEANPEKYNELASLKVFDKLIWSHPAFDGDSIYTRSFGEVARVRVTDGATATQRKTVRAR